jgi:hypothetical protein
MIAHWISDPVHGTKDGYSKLAMMLAERVEVDLVPKAVTKKTAVKKRAAPPEASSSGSSYPRNVQSRGGQDTSYSFKSGVASEPERGVAPQLLLQRQPRRRWAWRRWLRWWRLRKRPRVQLLLLERVCSDPAQPRVQIVILYFFIVMCKKKYSKTLGPHVINSKLWL